jgi:hypothetical protein
MILSNKPEVTCNRSGGGLISCTIPVFGYLKFATTKGYDVSIIFILSALMEVYDDMYSKSLYALNHRWRPNNEAVDTARFTLYVVLATIIPDRKEERKQMTHFLYIHCLLNDAVNTSGYKGSNGRSIMNNDW